ncbi:MAG: VWA domain-containing protein [Ardenticatenia bacterium]|nr:VWA domain-containing protein [Ardenticatenia bacterium]
MIWVFIIALAAWVAAGWILLWLKSRPVGDRYQRRVSSGVNSIGEQIEVELRLAPEFDQALTGEHDVLLLIDHSGSMGAGPGSPLREAVRAAENFVQRLPSQMWVGVISFDDGAQILQKIDGDHRAALRALGAIGPGGGTAIDVALERALVAIGQGRADTPKTVILLSDGDSNEASATAAADRLKWHEAAPTIITIGFGPGVNDNLMRAIAGRSDGADSANCALHVDNVDDFQSLFALLAGHVTGQLAIAGLVNEGVRAPHPFVLQNTGGLHPLGVKVSDETRVLWSVPLMDLQPIRMTYQLVGGCPGWMQAALDDSDATWRMPDGSQLTTRGPIGPYVLVMPASLRWAWPILNPLFWMLFGRYFCRQPAAALPVHDPIPALPTPSFPDPVPAPHAAIYAPKLTPALVIGLGAAGEWAVCSLKERLVDRGVPLEAVDLLIVQCVHPANRAPVVVAGTAVEGDERVVLHQDLRPYLDRINADGRPEMRAWVPVREWLAEVEPQTTVRSLGGDRRRARLALLNQPLGVEKALAPGLARVRAEDGMVLVVGAADDAEASGMLAEVAHMCATQGVGVTALMAAPDVDSVPDDGLAALVRELQRMTANSGEDVMSDRSDPPVAARRVFDRIVVLNQHNCSPAASGAEAADALWSLLAYADAPTRLFANDNNRNTPECWLVDLQAQALPVDRLWRWVRERTLATLVNGHWLAVETGPDGQFAPARPDDQRAAGYSGMFWSGNGMDHPPSLLLSSLSPQGRTGGHLMVLLTISEQLPLNRPYHEQVVVCDAERRAFQAYVAAWVMVILEQERQKTKQAGTGEQRNGEWGLPTLIQAIDVVLDDFDKILDQDSALAGSADFASLTSFASAMVQDFRIMLRDLRRDAACWIVAFIGPQVDQGIIASSPVHEPVYESINSGWMAAKTVLNLPNPESKDRLEKHFEQWQVEHGTVWLDCMRFAVATGPTTGHLRLRLHILDAWLDSPIDIAARMRLAMDRYRPEVLRWPDAGWYHPVALTAPGSRYGLGLHAADAYPGVGERIDDADPFFAATVRSDATALDVALRTVNTQPTTSAMHVWPEEANAERLQNRIRHRLEITPQRFSPAAVHLLRNVERLRGFFGDVARNAISAQAGEYVLTRGMTGFVSVTRLANRYASKTSRS